MDTKPASSQTQFTLFAKCAIIGSGPVATGRYLDETRKPNLNQYPQNPNQCHQKTALFLDTGQVHMFARLLVAQVHKSPVDASGVCTSFDEGSTDAAFFRPEIPRTRRAKQ